MHSVGSSLKIGSFQRLLSDVRVDGNTDPEFKSKEWSNFIKSGKEFGAFL